MLVINVLRRLFLILRERPVFAASLLVVIVLGTAELRDEAAGSSLSPEEQRIVASVHATATAQAAASSRGFFRQPLTEDQGVGDGEAPAAAYPAGAWTVGWSYNCGSVVAHGHFKLTLYDASDFSYRHGKRLVFATARSSSGLVHEFTSKPKPGSFLLDPETNCAWHVWAKLGTRRLPPAVPSPDHV